MIVSDVTLNRLTDATARLTGHKITFFQQKIEKNAYKRVVKRVNQKVGNMLRVMQHSIVKLLINMIVRRTMGVLHRFRLLPEVAWKRGLRADTAQSYKV